MRIRFGGAVIDIDLSGRGLILTILASFLLFVGVYTVLVLVTSSLGGLKSDEGADASSLLQAIPIDSRLGKKRRAVAVVLDDYESDNHLQSKELYPKEDEGEDEEVEEKAPRWPGRPRKGGIIGQPVLHKAPQSNVKVRLQFSKTHARE